MEPTCADGEVKSWSLTWTEKFSGDTQWKALAASEDFGILASTGASTYVAVSNDGGENWSQNGNQGSYDAVAASASGQKLVALDYALKSGIWVSSDFGATWANGQRSP